MEGINGVTRDIKFATKTQIGLGYIAIPFGVDRNKFVKSCYRKERVHIIFDQGGTMFKNCYIDSNVLQQIKFPETCRSLGSQVVFIMHRFNAVPIIVASVTRTRERIISDEEQFTINKSIKGGNLSITGSGNGNLIINLSSIDGSKVKLNLKGENSSLEINNDGTTTINSESDIILNSSSKVVKNYLNDSGVVEKSLTLDNNGLTYLDDKGNKFFIDYENNKIIHNDGAEPIPLGNVLQDELDKLNKKFNRFLDAFSNAIIVAGDGGAASQTAVKLATSTLKDADFDNINSSKSFIL